MTKVHKMVSTAAVCLLAVLWAAGSAFAAPGDPLPDSSDLIPLLDDVNTGSADDGAESESDDSNSGPGAAAGGSGTEGAGGTSNGDNGYEAYGTSSFDNNLYEQCRTITNKESAAAMMTAITVPVWRLKGQTKVAGTVTLTVNSGIADAVSRIFQEIYEGPQQFPISDAGGFSWRGEGSRSEHNWGTALDLNSNSNYCVYTNGTVVGDHWTPGEDPYSFAADSDVVKAFKKHGFAWGGDWPWGNRDYMHFSYFGT